VRRTRAAAANNRAELIAALGAFVTANVHIAAVVLPGACPLASGRTENLTIAPQLERLTVADMDNRLNPNIGRRDVLRVLAAGAGAAAVNAAPVAAAAPETKDAVKKRRAGYQANSPEVQTFYRVNRYPAK
jgi:hypothetical protein